MTTTFHSRFDSQGTYYRLEYRDAVFTLGQGLASDPRHVDSDESMIFLGGDAITWLLTNASILMDIIPEHGTPRAQEPEISITNQDPESKFDENDEPVLYEMDAALRVVSPTEFARERRVTMADGYGRNHRCRFRLNEPLDLPEGWQGTLELDYTNPAVKGASGEVLIPERTFFWGLGVIVLEEQDGILVVHLTRPPEPREDPTQEVAQ